MLRLMPDLDPDPDPDSCFVSRPVASRAQHGLKVVVKPERAMHPVRAFHARAERRDAHFLRSLVHDHVEPSMRIARQENVGLLNDDMDCPTVN